MIRLLPLIVAAILSTPLTVHAQDKGSPPTPFACPMKCEGPRTYPDAGNCPDCGMKLKALPAAPAHAITAATVKPSAPIVAGRETTLLVSARTPLPGAATVSILRHDHDWSTAVEASTSADGSLSLTTTFPADGDYSILVEPAPSAPGAAVALATLRVGAARSPSPMLDPAGGQPKRVGPYLVVLSTEQTPVARRPFELRFEVAQAGSPVTELDPSFGASGHCLLASQDMRSFSPSHPIDPASLPGPEEMECDMPEMDMTPEPGTPRPAGFVFRTVPPEPGLYTAWFRFRHCGQVHTVPFVVNVQPSEGTETGR